VRAAPAAGGFPGKITQMIWRARPGAPVARIEAIDVGENTAPRSLRQPNWSSSMAISRKDSAGLTASLRGRLASCTNFGLTSIERLRPPALPPSARLRSRAALSLRTAPFPTERTRRIVGGRTPSFRRRCRAKRVTSRVAIPAGFEPATHGVEIRYSIQLSYGTVERFIALPI
jgi:hypothetical protein